METFPIRLLQNFLPIPIFSIQFFNWIFVKFIYFQSLFLFHHYLLFRQVANNQETQNCGGIGAFGLTCDFRLESFADLRYTIRYTTFHQYDDWLLLFSDRIISGVSMTLLINRYLHYNEFNKNRSTESLELYICQDNLLSKTCFSNPV